MSHSAPTDPDDSAKGDMLNVGHAALVPFLASALQEFNAKVHDLTEQLKARLDW